MSLLKPALLILCLFHLASSKPLLTTVTENAETYTEQSASQTTTTQSATSSAPGSTDHTQVDVNRTSESGAVSIGLTETVEDRTTVGIDRTSDVTDSTPTAADRSSVATEQRSGTTEETTTQRSATTPGQVVYETGKAFATAVNLFVTSVQGIFRDTTPESTNDQNASQQETTTESYGRSTSESAQSTITKDHTEGENTPVDDEDVEFKEITTMGVRENSTDSENQNEESTMVQSEGTTTFRSQTEESAPSESQVKFTASEIPAVETTSMDIAVDVTTSENQPEETISASSVDVTFPGQQATEKKTTKIPDDVNTESDSMESKTTKSTTDGKYTTELGTGTGADDDVTYGAVSKTSQDSEYVTENSLKSQTTKSTTDGKYMTATGNIDDVTYTATSKTSTSEDPETKTEDPSAATAKFTTESPTSSATTESDRAVTTKTETTLRVPRSTAPHSTTDQPVASSQSDRTTAAPSPAQHATSNACGELRYIWNGASVTLWDTEVAIEHYCTHADISREISPNGLFSDCMSVARYVVENYPHLIFPEVVDTLANGTSLHAVLNLGLQAAIEHQYLVNNISDMEEKDFCRPAHDFGMACSANQNCENPTQPAAQFFCRTYSGLSAVDFDQKDLVSKYKREMAQFGIQDDSDPHVDIQFPGGVQGNDVLMYTLGGLFNTHEQMCRIQKGLEAICDDIPKSSCELTK